jgi:GNAT superfamily N-acetyltransferase
VARSNAASFSAMAAASPGGRVARFADTPAALVPAAPERPLLSAVFALGGAGFDEAYAWVEDGCRETGIDAFTVWLAEDDAAGAAEMKRRGHALDGMPPLMAARLDALHAAPAPALPELEQPTAAMAAELNDLAYGYPGSFTRALAGTGRFPFLLSVIADEGRPVACGAGLPVGADFHLTMVATRPEYRGRVLAAGLVTGLVARAREAGCTTSSLVASAAGVPLYARLGYSQVGVLQMWERRLR